MRRWGFLAVLAATAAFLLPLSGSAQVPLQPDIVETTPWTCTGEQNRNLVRITPNNGGADAIQFRTNCSGRLGAVQVEGTFADCLKFNPPPPAAHDLVIESGYCHVTGPANAGVHQDCIQGGGGSDITIRNFVFDCIGGGGGNYYINTFNGGTPTRFICEHCAFGPRHPNQIRPETSPTSGVKDSLVCQSTSGRATYLPASGNMGGNIEPPANDPRCDFAGLLAYVQDEPPPPPPPACDQACVDAYEAQIVSLEDQNAELHTQLSSSQIQVSSLEAQIASLEDQNAELHVQLSSTQVQVASLEAQVVSLEGQRAELQSQLAVAQAEVSFLQARVATLTAERDVAQAEVARLVSIIDRARVHAEDTVHVLAEK